MKKIQSIKTRLLLMGIIIPVLVLLSISLYLLFSFSAAQYNAEITTLQLEAEGLEHEILQPLNENFEILHFIRKLPVTIRAINDIPDSLNWENYTSIESFQDLQSILKAEVEGSDIDLLYVASEVSRGFTADRNPGLPDWYDARERPWYKDSVALYKSFIQQHPGEEYNYISNPYITAEEGAESELAITMAHPVLSLSTKEILGVVALDYNITGIINRLKKFQNDSGYEIRLYLKSEGVVIWSEDTGMIDVDNPVKMEDMAEEYSFNNFNGDTSQEIVKQLQTLNESISFQGNLHGGNPAIFFNSPIDGTPWSLLISVHRDVIYSQIKDAVIIPLASMCLIFLLASVIVYIFISRSIIRPINMTTEQLTELNSGDADLTHRLELNISDEIGQMAGKFDAFIVKLHGMIKEVGQVIEGTENIKDQLVSSTEETSASLEEISANVQSMEKQMQSLDSNVSQSTSSIEEISSNMNNVDNQINDQAAMVEESTAAITEMISSLESVAKIVNQKQQTTRELTDIADKGQQLLVESNRTFTDVVNQISSIQEMTNTINSISAQTNLLSMNAAIEAAHAGDAGRGFAVVAEEIRKLADSARNSSGKITQNIKEITGSVEATKISNEKLESAFKDVVQEVKDTVNAFLEIEQSIHELNTGSKQVLQASTEINNVTIQIRNGSAEIKAGTVQLKENSSDMKKISSQINSGAVEVSLGTKEIINAMQLLVELSGQMDHIVNELKQNFGQFKV